MIDGTSDAPIFNLVETLGKLHVGRFLDARVRRWRRQDEAPRCLLFGRRRRRRCEGRRAWPRLLPTVEIPEHLNDELHSLLFYLHRRLIDCQFNLRLLIGDRRLRLARARLIDGAQKIDGFWRPRRRVGRQRGRMIFVVVVEFFRCALRLLACGGRRWRRTAT